MNGHEASHFAFTDPLVVLGATALVIPIVYRFKISPVVGFIMLGILLGPFGLGSLASSFPLIGYVTITSQDSIEPVAEWGVVLLLFMIGLELSFERLTLMRRLVFGLGPAQVIVCATAITGLVMLTGAPVLAAIVVGLALAQSSTAVLVQTLAAEKTLSSPVGRTSFAVLLFQDIAVVPILFGIAVLGAQGAPRTFTDFGLAIGQAALAIVALIVVGRIALRPLFRSVARTQGDDVFLAACLLVILAASVAASAGGLSAAMGALIAGLLLAETEYRRQIEVLIEPFKNLFLGVFLIAAGMSIDPRAVLAAPALVIGGGLAIVAVKAGLIFLLARAFGLPGQTALGVALLLGPGGEFAFVILGAARGLNLVPPALAQGALLIAALTMTSIPFLLRLYERLARRSPREPAPINPALLPPASGAGEPRVVIAGFGRVGRVVAEMLETHKIAYIALDTNVDIVSTARREQKPVYYGDAANPAMLRQIGLDHIRALVATMDSSEAVEAIVDVARKARADLLIVARARDAHNAARLYRLGASDVAPETIEASLQLSETVLVDLGVPMGPVIASIHDRRAAFRDAVQKLEPGAAVPTRPRRRLRDAVRRRD